MNNIDVIKYIYDMVDELKSKGINLDELQVQEFINKYVSRRDLSYDDIILEIDRAVEKLISNVQRKKENHEELVKNISNMKSLQDLPVKYNGITLNNQDIDLMMIACSDNINKLLKALEKITNIRVSLAPGNVTDSEFRRIREDVYDMYLKSLSSRNDLITKSGIQLKKKVDYLKHSGILDDYEIDVLDGIVSSSKNYNEIVSELNSTFSNKIHSIYEVIRDFTPVEKEGITLMTVAKSRRLAFEILKNYNSITIDEEVKYSNVVLPDGSFYYKHLDKALNYVKGIGKKARLNALIFYMDCPNVLYNLPVNEENKNIVKKRLINYVDGVTKFIGDNYSDVVRSIDVFNELLCRCSLNDENAIIDYEGFSLAINKMGKEMPGAYAFRGDLPQDFNLYKNFDNVKSGWFKHLDIEDLCDVIAVARKNLPNVDFMYNDDNLTDLDKLDFTFDVIKRIQVYEETHGIKLIDSIGTQMHIDNSFSCENVKNMFIKLSELSLPIEITEFDMAMIFDVVGLSPYEIQAIRLQKLDEIYNIIVEALKICDIRGFTIWSKTDSQNFRVYLENTFRIRQGLDPIETLYGGFFCEDMTSKEKMFNRRLNYNYHTHTSRCGHASISDDSKYIEAARKSGIMKLGFSDHVPYSSFEYPDLANKMHISEVDEYINSINLLMEENPDMEILCGFEAEYDSMKRGFLGELRNKVDYLILGQHYVKEGLKNIKIEGNPYYPIIYADSVCEAMSTGLFDIVGHPDIFMRYRDSFKSFEEKMLFDESAEKAAKKICETASDLGIPLEINLTAIDKNEIMNDGNYSYPCPKFWDIASTYDVLVLYGIDAHDCSQFDNLEQAIDKVEEIIDFKNLTFVSDDYNPVVARKNNLIIKDLCNNSYSNSMTFESHLVYGMLNMMAKRISYKNTSDVGALLEENLKAIKDSFEDEADRWFEKVRLRSEGIKSDESLSDKEKLFALKRVEDEIKAIEATLGVRNAVVERTIESIKTATLMGCETIDEYVQVVTDLTEVRSEKNSEKANDASKRLLGLEEVSFENDLEEKN